MSRAEESLAALLGREPAGGPRFLADRRRAAAEIFLRVKLPTTKHEDWRYTSLSGLAQLDLQPAAQLRADAALLERLAGATPAPRLVFVNGRLDARLSDLSHLPPGAEAGSLASALAERPAAVEAHLGRHAALGDHAFAALNGALFEDGAYLELAPGTSGERPIHVVHLALGAGGAFAAHPRNLVVAGAGAEACIVETYAGRDDVYLVNALTEVALAEGARVEHHRVQDEGPRAYHVGLLSVDQGAGSRFTAHSIALGGRLARVETRTLLGAEQAECTLNGLYLGQGEQVLDHLVQVDHASPRCTSRETFKGILDGASRGVFAGRIRVREGAQKTDAGQINANLILSEDATVDTKPQLEILADDVKCSHGGAVGQLSEDALFYLRSRGLDAALARTLLTWAFAAEMVERIRPRELRERVRDLVTARLPEGERLREAA